jgi:holo-[acyl-carrier protein] synthase
MIKGIGIDIIELPRVQEIINRQPRFIERVLCPSEIEMFKTLSGQRKAEFLAGRYAAKEAFSKATGTGIGKQLSFQDIEIATDRMGKPFILRPELQSHLSISHSREYAIAQVIIEQN